MHFQTTAYSQHMSDVRQAFKLCFTVHVLIPMSYCFFSDTEKPIFHSWSEFRC